MLSVEERANLIDTMRRFPDELEALVKGIPANELVMSYIPGEWSIAQNVHHLADNHMNAFFRFKRILIHNSPEIVHFDQKNWARTIEATIPGIGDSLMILRGLHQRWCYLMENLSETEWVRYGMHDQAGLISLEDMLLAYAHHCDLHLKQIKETLEIRNK